MSERDNSKALCFVCSFVASLAMVVCVVIYVNHQDDSVRKAHSAGYMEVTEHVYDLEQALARIELNPHSVTVNVPKITVPPSKVIVVNKEPTQVLPTPKKGGCKR